MRCRLAWSIVTAAMMTACSTPSTGPSQAPQAARKILLEQACPQLTPLADASFGATTVKLTEVAGVYHECRCVALELPCRPHPEEAAK